MRVGARLQMLQASFADDDAAARAGYIEEEIERELRAVPPGSRAGFLEALTARFPAWEAPVAAPVGFAPAPSAPVAPAAPASPTSLVEQLATMADGLSADARKGLAHRLQQAGYAVTVAAARAADSQQSDEIPVELQKKLSMDANVPIDRQRAMKLAAVLIDLVVTMDQLSWNVWKSLAPNSIVRRDPGATGDLKKLAAPYLLGDNEVSTAQITQLLDKTRQLIAGLLAAVGSTGEAFARQHLSRFSPQSIKEQAEADPGFFIGAEQKCWRKYIELFNATSGVAIENEIANLIVKYTEDLILGAGRPSTESGS